MTQERFHRLLDNPDLLATISYEEMKTLALAYPYSHNLRYLLAIKSKQDNHPDAERALAAAAAYSLDRRQLFMLTAPQLVSQQVAAMAEEIVLELKPIEAVQRELQALAPQSRTEQTDKKAVVETAPALAEAQPVQNPVSDFKYSIPIEKTTTTENQHPPQHSLAQPFAIWVGRFNPPVLEPKLPKQTISLPLPPKEEFPSPARSAQELAERSVAENKDVISETLARLLGKQGYRDKAIHMYERLSLAFPEKSAFFAAEIEKLKK